MADVQVLITQFCTIREIDWQVSNWIDRKLDRTLKTIQKENP